MTRYASETKVSPDRSIEQIKAILRRYGATKFGQMEEETRASIMFEVKGLTVVIEVPLPSSDEEEFRLTSRYVRRSTSVQEELYRKAIRQRWRALLLVIKAKLEAIESHISTLEKEFGMFVIGPDGRPIGDHLIPKLRQFAKDGKLPKILALPAPTEVQAVPVERRTG